MKSRHPTKKKEAGFIDLSLERRALGSLLANTNWYDTLIQVAGSYYADLFADCQHEAIWQAIQSHIKVNRRKIDAALIASTTRKLSGHVPNMEDIESYLEALEIEGTDSEEIFKEYIKQLLGAAKEREINQKLSESMLILSDRTVSIEDRNQTIQALILKDGDANTGKLSSGTSILSSTLRRIDELGRQEGTIVTGLPTGIDDLDVATTGLQPSDLIVIAGRPSMGKTAFAMRIVESCILTQKKYALVFSFEMPAQQLMMRMLSSVGRIDHQHLRTGILTEEEWPRLAEAANLLNNDLLQVWEDVSDLATAVSVAESFARKHPGELGMIMVDYLQLMSVKSPRILSRNEELSEISRTLKNLAKKLGVPVVAVSQLNRSLELRSNKRPINSDLRESGAIEQDADMILFVYRDEVYNPDNVSNRGVAEIIIGKQRNGPIGPVYTAFIHEYTRFENRVKP